MRDAAVAPRQDAEHVSEIELCTTLFIASSGSDRVLSQAEVDLLLGVRPRTRR